MTKSSLFSFIWFYLGWFGCVYLANKPQELLSFLFPAVAYFWLISHDKKSPRFIFALLALSIIGMCFDFLSVRFGLLHLHQSVSFPFWLVALWALFASSLPSMLDFLGKRLVLAAALGAVGGPCSYFYGQAFDILSFSNNTAIIVYALFWACYTPLSLIILRRLQ